MAPPAPPCAEIVRQIIGNPGDTGWQAFCPRCGLTALAPTEASALRTLKAAHRATHKERSA